MYIDYLTLAYLINFILLLIATYTDIKTREIPHWIVILMLLINLPVGYFYFGIDCLISFITTLILCLILGIGMGGGDIKLFAALSPIFLNTGTIYYIPKGILFLIGLSAAIAAFYPMTNILKRYWKDILPSSIGLATLFGILVHVIIFLQIPNGTLLLWAYIIISIFISRKFPQYKLIIKNMSYIAPFYLIGSYILSGYNINTILSFIIYIGELTLISVVIYALTGVEISFKKKISDLKEGDILRDIIYIKGDDVKVEGSNILKRFKLMVNLELNKVGDYDKIIMTDGEGLYKEDIQLLKELKEKNKIPEELNIIQTYPYVPFVLVSYIVLMGIMIYFGKISL